MGPISDTVAIFPRRIGRVVRGVGWHVKSFLLGLFTGPVEPSRFASSVVTPRGDKAGLETPAQPTSSGTISFYFSASFPTTEKRK
jgi:hypothetical protein